MVKKIYKGMNVIGLQTYNIFCTNTISTKDWQKIKLQSLLRPHDFEYIQSDILYLWLHDPDSIFLVYHQHYALVYKTNHPELLSSKLQLPLHCILWFMQDVWFGNVHWHVVLGCVFCTTFDIANTTCVTTVCLKCLISSTRMHSKLPVLCILYNYYFFWIIWFL